MNETPLTTYRGYKIILHVDAGYIVIQDNVIIFAAPTREEAIAWIDMKETDE